MSYSNFRRIHLLLVMAVAALGCARSVQANDNRAPDVPPGLETPGDTNKVHFHAYAVGVQIYSARHSSTSPTGFEWNPASRPDAVLFDSDGDIVGSHYVGPTWESNSGSYVKGARVNGVTLNANDIPWLLLRAVSSSGPGVLNGTTYIQRVNTDGGIVPSTPPARGDDEASVPYTAEYYFYRAK
ncbi:MAG TPA: DUF3455 domain-containing protein [Candidatus Binatia bacterium]|nr:DUF3455 domain-containing protein [Candidatus Binatia bacterium]